MPRSKTTNEFQAGVMAGYKKPYQKYVQDNIFDMGVKTAFITECCNTIKTLSEYPEENMNQLMFFIGVLRYLKSL